jgi:mono/diheme cytochrome c family protein
MPAVGYRDAWRARSDAASMRVGALWLCTVLMATVATAQTPDAGQQAFVSHCARCHGTDGNGGEFGPSITARIPVRTDGELSALFREGLPAAGMPAISNLTPAETPGLIGYLRTLTCFVDAASTKQVRGAAYAGHAARRPFAQWPGAEPE